jgi:hypothetical protein
VELASLVLAALVAALPADPAAAPPADPAPAAEPAPAVQAAPAEPAPAPVAPPPSEPAPVAAPTPAPAKKPFSFGVWGALPFGEKWATAVTPVEASVQIYKPDTSYAFGIVGEYAVSPEIRIFFDGGLYSQSVEVIQPGSRGTSFWVYEQQGYSGDHSIGPYPDGVRYYMETTALRVGAAYVMPLGSMSAWAGATVGAYKWTATYGNKDAEVKWGQTSDTVTGITFIGGVDMPLGTAATIGLFADLASPAAEGTIDDLFYKGWSFSFGHHVMGPYRVGIRLLTSM